MNRTILYYPTIDIPSNNWLRHALLYWDEVSSIVPKSHDNRILGELSPDIHYLMGEGQFRPIKPEDLIYNQDNWDAFHQFRTEFTDIILSNKFQQFIQRQHRSSYRIHSNKIAISTESRIHNNKVSDSLFQLLEEHGLAKRNTNNYEWVFFEKNTALLYMSLLAKYLADIDSEQTTIGTDLTTYESFNFKRVNENEGFPVVTFNLDNVLPSPRANVPLERILDFKRKRQQNLQHFKRHLSDFQIRVSNTQSQAELKEVAISFQEGLMTGIEDLKSVLSDSKIESGFKSFKALINLKSPTMFATAGALLNNRFDFVNLPVSLANFGLATIGAIELTGNYIEQKNKQRAKLRESPFSYIYHAQRYGLINRKPSSE